MEDQSAADTNNTRRANQATSSKAIGSSGGDHDERTADSTVEWDNVRCLRIRCREIKGPRGWPNTSVSGTVQGKRKSGTVEYTERYSEVRVKGNLVQWSTRKEAQDAKKMETNTTHFVILRRDQPVYFTWEVLKAQRK